MVLLSWSSRTAIRLQMSHPASQGWYRLLRYVKLEGSVEDPRPHPFGHPFGCTLGVRRPWRPVEGEGRGALPLGAPALGAL